MSNHFTMHNVTKTPGCVNAQVILNRQKKCTERSSPKHESEWIIVCIVYMRSKLHCQDFERSSTNYR